MHIPEILTVQNLCGTGNPKYVCLQRSSQLCTGVLRLFSLHNEGNWNRLGRFCFQPMFMAAFSTQAAADAHLTAFYQSIFCIIALKSWLEELYEFCCILHCTGIQKYVCVQKFSAKKFADKILIQKYQTMSSENLKPLIVRLKWIQKPGKASSDGTNYIAVWHLINIYPSFYCHLSQNQKQ